MKQKNDQWRYLTIVTKFHSFDLEMSSKQDAFDFIISINQALIKQNDNYLRIQSQKVNDYSAK